MKATLPPFLDLFEHQPENTLGIVCPVCGAHEVGLVHALTHPYPNAAPDDWPCSVEIVMYCDSCVEYFSLQVAATPLLGQSGEDLSAGPCSDDARRLVRERYASEEPQP